MNWFYKFENILSELNWDRLTPSKIIDAIDEGIIQLSEVVNWVNAIINDIDKQLTPKVQLQTLEYFNTNTYRDPNQTTQRISDYTKFQSILLKSPHNSTASFEADTYINYEDNIYKIIKQVGDVFVIYYPRKSQYHIINIHQDTDDQDDIIRGAQLIEPSPIEWYFYYRMNARHVWYFYISPDGKTQNICQAEWVEDLVKFWDIIYFRYIKEGYINPLMLIKGYQQLTVDSISEYRFQLEDRSYLYIRHPIDSRPTWQNNPDYKVSLFDTQSFDYIFKRENSSNLEPSNGTSLNPKKTYPLPKKIRSFQYKQSIFFWRKKVAREHKLER